MVLIYCMGSLCQDVHISPEHRQGTILSMLTVCWGSEQTTVSVWKDVFAAISILMSGEGGEKE